MRVLDKARTLRHQPTPAEAQLWQCLRNRQLSGYKFRRQYPVGEYIADFACITAGVIVELDGNHHADPEQHAYDDVRTLFLQTAGFRILRFWNNQILDDLPTVLQTIEHSLHSPSPALRERGGRGVRASHENPPTHHFPRRLPRIMGIRLGRRRIRSMDGFHLQGCAP